MMVSVSHSSSMLSGQQGFACPDEWFCGEGRLTSCVVVACLERIFTSHMLFTRWRTSSATPQPATSSRLPTGRKPRRALRITDEIVVSVEALPMCVVLFWEWQLAVPHSPRRTPSLQTGLEVAILGIYGNKREKFSDFLFLYE
jgi:hypothetical protein